MPELRGLERIARMALTILAMYPLVIVITLLMINGVCIYESVDKWSRAECAHLRGGLRGFSKQALLAEELPCTALDELRHAWEQTGMQPEDRDWVEAGGCLYELYESGEDVHHLGSTIVRPFMWLLILPLAFAMMASLFVLLLMYIVVIGRGAHRCAQLLWMVVGQLRHEQ